MVQHSLCAKILFSFLILFCLPAHIVAASVLPAIFELDDGYLSIGLLDITVGVNQLTGLIEPASESDQYKEGIYLDGRLAFFLKGRIKGSALITAWLDTGVDPSGTIFDKLDPTRYYPVYGDDSTTLTQVASQGSLYLKLDAPEYQAIWGNYQADLQGGSLSAYHRSLYGFQLEGVGAQGTTFKAFHSNPESLHSRDTLMSTGGLLYYLRHGSVSVGSERVQVEIRDSFTGRALANHLLAAEDYLIDYLQGRLILKKDVERLAVSEDIILDNLKGEKQVYLIVDYDYEAGSTVTGATVGYQFSSQLAEGLRYSNTVYQESTGVGEPYNLFGLDVNYASPGGFHFDASFAESGSVLSGKNISDDGGLTYHADPSFESLKGGGAYQLGTRFNLNSFSRKMPDIRIEGNYSHWDEGFTNQRYTYLEDNESYDLSLSGELTRETSWRTQYLHDLADSKLINEVKVVHPVNNKITVKGEVQHTSENAGEDVKGALLAEYQLSPKTAIFGSQQLTLYNSNHIPDNRATIGAQHRLSDNFGVNLEVSIGNSGDSVELGGEYDFGDGLVYSGVNVHEQDNGQVVETTLGSRGRVNAATTVFSERKVTLGNDEESTSDVLGLDYALGNRWGISFDYSKSAVLTAEEQKINREIFTPGLVYVGDDLEGRLKLQFRDDHGLEELDQYVITSSVKYRYNQELSLSANLDHSATEGAATALAEYSKASVGFAYRPIKHDRVNLLGMYTYQLDTAPQDQEGVVNTKEKARIISVEGIYELNRYWQLAQKLAYKNAAVRVGDELYNSDTHLWITRANYRLNQDWDAYGEYRILRNIQAEDSRSGFLLGITRDLGENLQVGIGYNFTDFNDDLTELDYNARGLFVNFSTKW